ncbi:DUF523 domain-containing protein [Teredinibacter sp. KSP-S5-2]|uniref:DUF523 domain-containing protein n=1 Tax=Teredinibacter sp. KSP-S5-2 TaxID=3034506 RepID=UPI002934AA34|nr:DUF523 domain-containing protein [Teredinibacter sp. KSP-S5-2]WNO09006.1 DUF523 domain-containing protein [Teredinibacter sp. KSP-S5-2]
MDSIRKIKPVVVVSACLLGEKVRYDGQHKQQGSWLNELSDWVEIQKVCPEVESGLSTPRPPVHLVKKGDRIRAVGRDIPSLDVTDQLVHFSTHFHQCQVYDAAILKSRSPSCGVGSTPHQLGDGKRVLSNGIFSQALMDAFSTSIVFEESWFNDGGAVRDFLLATYLESYLKAKLITQNYQSRLLTLIDKLTNHSSNDYARDLHNELFNKYIFWPDLRG